MPDALGFAVACALHDHGWPLRIAYYVGTLEDLTINTFGSPPDAQRAADLALYAEYVPPGPVRRQAPKAN